MGEASLARVLILGADVVPEVGRDDWRLVILMHDDAQTILERELLERNIQIVLRHERGGEHQCAGLAAIAAVQHDGAGIAGRRNGILLFTGCQSAEAERENQVAQRVHGLTQDDRM